MSDDELLKMKAELAFYKGFHDGIHSTGTHVVVERDLLDECERALDRLCYWCTQRDVVRDEVERAKATLAKLRGQEKADD